MSEQIGTLEVISLREYIEIDDDINTISNQMTDDIIDRVESFDVVDDNDGLYNVMLYDGMGEVIIAIKVEDSDVAIAYLEDVFDIEFEGDDDDDDYWDDDDDD